MLKTLVFGHICFFFIKYREVSAWIKNSNKFILDIHVLFHSLAHCLATNILRSHGQFLPSSSSNNISSKFCPSTYSGTMYKALLERASLVGTRDCHDLDNVRHGAISCARTLLISKPHLWEPDVALLFPLLPPLCLPTGPCIPVQRLRFPSCHWA